MGLLSLAGAAFGLGKSIGDSLFGDDDQQAPNPGVNLTPAQMMRSQARGAEIVAKKHGFNPLTMLKYGATGSGMGIGATGGSAPPLASTEAIMGYATALDDQLSGDAERRAQADKLNLDLAKVKLEQARAELKNLSTPPQALLGRQAVTVPTAGGAVFNDRVSLRPKDEAAKPAQGVFREESTYAPDRDVNVQPLNNAPGVFRMNNALTGGNINIPGDTEPWGVDELITAAVFGIPSAMGNHANRMIFDGKRFPEIVQSARDALKEKSEKERKERDSDPLKDYRNSPMYSKPY